MSGNRIVIVEDEQEMAEVLMQALTEAGFECQTAGNGKDGLELGRSADLLLVDVMMPEMDGFTMVETIRKEGIQVPAVYLTAKDQTADVVRGLDLGGDDYIIKPFKLEELLSRIKAALRRSTYTRPTPQWQDINLDLHSRRAFRGEHELFLSNTEFQLMEMLMNRPSEILSKSAILKEIWADEGYRHESIVELYVCYLRKKTESFGGERVIHTVKGEGYVLKNKKD